jgi:hypothetical protein
MREETENAIATLEELREHKLAVIKGNENHIESLTDENRMLASQVKAFDEAIAQVKKFGNTDAEPRTPALIGKYTNSTLSEAILDIVNKGDNRVGLLVPEIITILRSEGFKSKAKELYGSVYGVAMNLVKQGKIQESKKNGKRSFMTKADF